MGKKINFDDLKDKVCVITGGGGVIGTALAEGFAAVGARVAILDIVQEYAEKAAREITKKTSNKLIGIQADVLNKESLAQAKEQIHDHFGDIDILVNCAGGNSPKATTELETVEKSNLNELEKTFFGLSIDGFRQVFDLNFLGTLLPTMVFSSDMTREGGVVINISSLNSFRPLTKIPAYSAAKASINNFTEWLAVHLAKLNIRVNAIAPGFFLTQQNKFLLIDKENGDLTPRGKKILNNTPMGEFGDPNDLQGTALYLASGLSRFVTGVVILVDGGFNAYSGV